MSRPTAVIAEDEAILRDELKSLLAALWPELDVVAEAGNGVDARRLIETTSPDIVFLDIEMPGASGIEVARSLSGRSHVVFVTAYDDHAIEAFEHGAIDYVMKPFTPDRLAITITRVRGRLAAPPVQLERLLARLSDRPRAWLRWINASQGKNIRLITVGEICYFKADAKYTLVVTTKSEALIRKTIRDLIGQLDPETFLQIHRSTIVNIDAIATVHRCENGTCELALKERSERLIVSLPFVHLFRQM